MSEGLGIALLVAVMVFLVFVFWLGRPNPGSTRKGVQEAVEFFGGFVSSVFGCLVGLVLTLVALFAVIWLIKRMWEAA
jgi:hypothetical protein